MYTCGSNPKKKSQNVTNESLDSGFLISGLSGRSQIFNLNAAFNLTLSVIQFTAAGLRVAAAATNRKLGWGPVTDVGHCVCTVAALNARQCARFYGRDFIFLSPELKVAVGHTEQLPAWQS